jgi:hypothetical protein
MLGLTRGFLLAHELDAMRCAEWRILPGLSRLPDRQARPLFIALHVPLGAWLFAALADGPSATLAAALHGFAILHLGAHLWLLRHPRNRFRSRLSWSLILGGAAAGTAGLAGA